MLLGCPPHPPPSTARPPQVFMQALSQTRGLELSKMLWLKSSSSEEWLERRTNYARSLAVMSMAGYILGRSILLVDINRLGW